MEKMVETLEKFVALDVPFLREERTKRIATLKSLLPRKVSMQKYAVKTAGSDRDIILLVRIEPEYPPRALQHGIEGWVLVGFNITPIGRVTGARVVESEPPGIFDAAAIRAVSRWKYNPKIERPFFNSSIHSPHLLRWYCNLSPPQPSST